MTTTTTKEIETLRDDVRVGDIFLDESYGRPLHAKEFQRLVANWNRQRVGAIYLSLRPDGRFACLDGWHRVCACREVEGEDVALPARVYIDLTQKGEAELFAAFNRDRAKPQPGELFRARLSGGEQAAHEINAIVQALGLEVGLELQSRDKTITAVAALDKVYRDYGSTMLRDVLLTIRNTMGTSPSTFRSELLKGLAAFIARYGGACDRARLFAVLEQTSVQRLVSSAHGIRAVTPSYSGASALGVAIVELYNSGLKSKHLPPWQKYIYNTSETREGAVKTGLRNIEKAHASRRIAANGTHRA